MRACVHVCVCVSGLYIHMQPQPVSVADIGDGRQRVEGPVHSGPRGGVHVEWHQTLDTWLPLTKGRNPNRPSLTIHRCSAPYLGLGRRDGRLQLPWDHLPSGINTANVVDVT